MKKSYYLFNPGRLSRKDNTLKFTPVNEKGEEEQPRYLPVEGVSELYCFGSLDANSALYNFLGQQGISVHFFDYYEHYTGSFHPKEYLLAGKVLIKQVEMYQNKYKRTRLARFLIEGAAFNMMKNLKYYGNRGRDLTDIIQQMESLSEQLSSCETTEEVMGIEGMIRQTYYKAFDEIISDFEMDGRSKQPPQNEINALLSFCNMMCYTVCLGQLYHTQLNPTISFLHEPGYRRYSLALDLSEIFKPILVDRLVFRLLNKKEIQKDDFDFLDNAVLLKPKGKKAVVKAWEERLAETIQHRKLGRSVSYKHLIKLESYKLVKHIMEIETYQPFKMWW